MKRIKLYKMPRRLVNRIARISALSFILVLTTFLGLYGGLYLDKITHMAPNFTLLGLVIGIILGFRGFIHEAMVERRGES
jgi:F0F1-type ATP synthase assembly protein I